MKKLKYWNKFYGKEEERRGRGGEERLKRKKRERESRKKVKTTPYLKREREREREGGCFITRGKASMKKPMGRREKKGKNK